jgi:hypothetical protein
MYKSNEKFESSSRPRKLIGKVLRLLRANTKLQTPVIGHDRIVREEALLNTHCNSLKEYRIALLNAESRKAEALMELHKHLRLC